ncbi:hypothetical protein [Devriesea agamarum]|uniref:hypothetical protein n=1 Tax=Devriesea agamarum TaxID=472569 RepID=UPI00071E4BC4|nr:hypothetical protein [Devriesea agamarum]
MKIIFHREGFEQLRNDPRIKKDLMERAERIQKEASQDGKVHGYIVTDLVLEVPRGAVSVMATGPAMRDNRKHNRLLRSLEAGR